MSKIQDQPNLALAKKMNIAAWIITVAVLGLVGLMRRVKIELPEGISFDFLPPVHATLNAFTALILIYALYQVKQRNIEAHRRAIYVAFFCSFLFLLSYVAYHFTNTEIKYGDVNLDGVVDAAELALLGSKRTIYLLLLFSHIVLAAISFPFILFTFIRGYTGQYARHRKMARWVFPVWLYVAITGPIVYWMLQPYYPG